MILNSRYTIPQKYIDEAVSYANISCGYTSDRHDFHSGGLDAKREKMLEGKMGEKIFKMFLCENNIDFLEDKTDHTIADDYDFILPDGIKIDVKTRTKSFHTRTLEMVEQFEKKPKDIYVSIRLFPNNSGEILGFFSKEQLLKINRIENQGYLDNYVMYDSDLHSIKELYENYLIFHTK